MNGKDKSKDEVKVQIEISIQDFEFFESLIEDLRDCGTKHCRAVEASFRLEKRLGEIAPFWRKHRWKYTGTIPCTGQRVCIKCGIEEGENIGDLCQAWSNG